MAIEALNDIKEEALAERCLEAPKYTCALGGALAVLTNIYRAIPIIHAGMGCGTNQLLSFRVAGGNQGVGYASGMMTPSSNISENEVVFGGEGRLREQLKSTLELIDGDLFVVTDGCISGMIGDDIDSIAKEFFDPKKPVLSVNASGFLGNTFQGYESVLSAIIDQLLESVPKRKKLVNLFGFIPFQDIFWRGNLREIKNLLGKLGVEVNQIIGDFSGLEGLRRISAAELTIVVSPWVGTQSAQRLEEKFEIPYINYPNLPVGPRESSEFLRVIGKALNIPDSEVEKVITEEEHEAYHELDLAGDACATYAASLPIAIIAGSATAIGLARFLANEAGFTPTLIVINDDPPEQERAVILDRLENLASGINPKVVFEVDSYLIRKHLQGTNFRVILGSSQERYLAQKERAVYVSVTYPASDRLVIRDTYAGYGGGIAILEDIISKFVQPY